MKIGGFKLIATIACAALVLFSAGSVFAKATGPCVNCHTMHNSQAGAAMNFDGSSTPNSTLLRAGTCAGCHMDVAAPAGVPQVNLGAGSYTAGGSFLFVDTANQDNLGHNVAALTNFSDDAHTVSAIPGAPGFRTDYNANTAVNNGVAWGAAQLTCAGTVGCHGTHGTETNEFAAIGGAHHADDATIDGASVGTSYRFLNGIVGIEDADYEAETVVDHNVYKGSTNRTDSDTISYLCAECHGNFHLTAEVGDGTTPWLRHPTDVDMRDVKYAGTEYASYVFDAEAPAALLAPVAAPDYSVSAVVTCVSCHRPHGSEYDDLLRWDYTGMDAGTTGAAAGTGCFRCHTTKDGI